MKEGIHPTLNPVVFVDTSSGKEFVTTSTLTSKETKKIDGVDHYIIKVEISSDSHPFYTGKAKLIDTAGRVEKFKARRAAAQANQPVKEEATEEDPVEQAETPAKETEAEEKPEVDAEETPAEEVEAPTEDEAEADNEEPVEEEVKEAA